MTNLRCFVAMAVGKPETDKLYDKLIKRVLREAGITSVFIGRLEHNDDIDNRIIKEIESCDFALADLTYARPSVYFEAGYALRKVPVIYTCREDHLKPRENDALGNFRIHFDLQMKNIIAWADSDDRSFIRRLKRRVTFVTRPLRRKCEAQERESREEREFHNLPLATRLRVLRELFGREVRRLGYRAIVKSYDHQPFAALKTVGRTHNLMLLWVWSSFTRTEIRECVLYTDRLITSRFRKQNGGDLYRESQWPGYTKPQPGKLVKSSKLTARLLLCSLNRTPAQRVDAALPSFGVNPILNARVAHAGARLSIEEALPLSVAVEVIDNISSERNAREKSSSLLPISKFNKVLLYGTGAASSVPLPFFLFG